MVSVSCGAEHTVALCKEGVYSWGSSSHGQVGLVLRHNISVFLSYLLVGLRGHTDKKPASTSGQFS